MGGTWYDRYQQTDIEVPGMLSPVFRCSNEEFETVVWREMKNLAVGHTLTTQFDGVTIKLSEYYDSINGLNPRGYRYFGVVKVDGFACVGQFMRPCKGRCNHVRFVYYRITRRETCA